MCNCCLTIQRKHTNTHTHARTHTHTHTHKLNVHSSTNWTYILTCCRLLLSFCLELEKRTAPPHFAKVTDSHLGIRRRAYRSATSDKAVIITAKIKDIVEIGKNFNPDSTYIDLGNFGKFVWALRFSSSATTTFSSIALHTSRTIAQTSRIRGILW